MPLLKMVIGKTGSTQKTSACSIDGNCSMKTMCSFSFPLWTGLAVVEGSALLAWSCFILLETPRGGLGLLPPIYRWGSWICLGSPVRCVQWNGGRRRLLNTDILWQRLKFVVLGLLILKQFLSVGCYSKLKEKKLKEECGPGLEVELREAQDRLNSVRMVWSRGTKEEVKNKWWDGGTYVSS